MSVSIRSVSLYTFSHINFFQNKQTKHKKDTVSTLQTIQSIFSSLFTDFIMSFSISIQTFQIKLQESIPRFINSVKNEAKLETLYLSLGRFLQTSKYMPLYYSSCSSVDEPVNLIYPFIFKLLVQFLFFIF